MQNLGKELIKKFELDKGKNPQQYGIGFKEIWEIDEKNHTEGRWKFYVSCRK